VAGRFQSRCSCYSISEHGIDTDKRISRFVILISLLLSQPSHLSAFNHHSSTTQLNLTISAKIKSTRISSPTVFTPPTLPSSCIQTEACSILSLFTVTSHHFLTSSRNPLGTKSAPTCSITNTSVPRSFLLVVRLSAGRKLLATPGSLGQVWLVGAGQLSLLRRAANVSDGGTGESGGSKSNSDSNGPAQACSTHAASTHSPTPAQSYPLP